MVNSSAEKTSVSVNEIAYVEKIRSYSEDELLKMGCSKEEVNYIKNYDYNKELLRLSNTGEKKLKKMGYSNIQIKGIKKYDGSTDAVSYVKVQSLSNAEMEFSFAPNLVCNKSMFTIFWFSIWSSPPIFRGTDIIALTWIACDSNSQPISMKYIDIPTCIVQYFKVGFEELYDLEHKTPKYNIGNLSCRIEVSKKSAPPIYNDDLYAKIVGGRVSLRTQSGSDNLYTIQFLGSYGHSTITLKPSVSFSESGASLGISYNWTMQDLDRTNTTYYYYGSVY